MKKSLSLAALAILGIAPLSSAVTAKKGALVTIPVTIELKAPPGAVWTALTSVNGLGTLTGFKALPGEKATLSAVGDSVRAKVWTDEGRVVVTELVPQKELRYSWEPANASYLCSARLVVKPSASGGTTLEFWDRYTDDQPNVDETAKKVLADTDQQVAAFRKIVEK